jgi:hypothetical protein
VVPPARILAECPTVSEPDCPVEAVDAVELVELEPPQEAISALAAISASHVAVPKVVRRVTSGTVTRRADIRAYVITYERDGSGRRDHDEHAGPDQR